MAVFFIHRRKTTKKFSFWPFLYTCPAGSRPGNGTCPGQFPTFPGVRAMDLSAPELCFMSLWIGHAQTSLWTSAIYLEFSLYAWIFLRVHTLSVWAANSLIRLYRCAGLPDSLLVPYAWKHIFGWPHSFGGSGYQYVYSQGSKLTVASSKFATWKFSLLPGQTVGSKQLLPGIMPQTLSTLSVVNVFSAN